MTKACLLPAALLAFAPAFPAFADDQADLKKLKEEITRLKEEQIRIKETSVNLIDALVKKGVLDQSKAVDFINAAAAKAEADIKRQRDEEAKVEKLAKAKAEAAEKQAKARAEAEAAKLARARAEATASQPPQVASTASAPASGTATGTSAGAAVAAGAAVGAFAGSSAGTAAGAAADQGKSGKSIHVAYVPEIVKDEIRAQVRDELRKEVAQDVKRQAKEEKWGIPAALPDWVTRIHPYFDNRLRLQGELYQPDNYPLFFDWLSVNQNGGLSQAQARGEAFLNSTIDRMRLRERFRVGFDADLTDHFKAGFRLATSNLYNPVSNNQTLGNTGQSYQIAIDRVFIQYDWDHTRNDWMTLWGGRIPNPWVSTDVVFDPDLSFEGIAGTFRLHLRRDDPVVKSYHEPNPYGRAGIQLGPQHPDSVFATLGVFPIQEVNFSSSDKWLFGMQMGADWLVHDESRLKFAASYYDYRNINARRNAYNSTKYDWTAPEFIQKGNSLVAINDAENQPACNTGALGAKNICLVGLASDFKIFNATAMFDYTRFAPTHVMLTGDYAHNFDFNQRKIQQEFGDDIAPKTNAFQVRLDVGRTELRHPRDWSMFFAYRYLERDAVLDAFTDSLFHQGGTDAKGWVVGAQYALAYETWVNLRWLASDAVSGPPYSIDTIALDLNSRFP